MNSDEVRAAGPLERLVSGLEFAACDAINHQGEIQQAIELILRTQWQPIETAPKDGTWVLLLGGSTGFDSDCFGSPPCVVGKWLTADEGYILSDDNGWQFAWYDSGVYGIYEAPTHWMPLPANTGIERLDGREG